MISNKDRELFKVMNESLKRYLKAAGMISQEAFELLSKHNGLLWAEISGQIDVFEELTKANEVEGVIPEKREKFTEKESVVEKEASTEKETSIEKEASTEKQASIEKEPVTKKEASNAPFILYDKVVSFLKTQQCDELQWVRTYSFKHPYSDFSDFQIKYFEHKDPLHETKNYIMFGNTKKFYSIRKAGDEILGDTSECFNIILNLSHVLKVD